VSIGHLSGWLFSADTFFDSVSSFPSEIWRSGRREIPLFSDSDRWQIRPAKKCRVVSRSAIIITAMSGNSDYQRLLDATIEHVSELKAQGILLCRSVRTRCRRSHGKNCLRNSPAKAPASIVRVRHRRT